MPDEKIPLFGEYAIDLNRGCLLCGGRTIHLRPQAYEVLKYLVENRGRLVAKNKLIESVWRGRAVTDDALVQCLVEVRQALGVQSKLYLRNVRGRGYIFDTSVGDGSPSDNWGQSTSPNDHKDSTHSSSEGYQQRLEGEAASENHGHANLSESNVTTRSRLRGVVLNWVNLVWVLVCLGAGVSILYLNYAPASQTQIRSIAVLPFANESGDQALDYMSDGLTENLIDSLSQLPGIKVVGRLSSFKYKGKEIDVQRLASALSVQGVVTGRVIQRGSDPQVRVDFIDTRDGTQLWGGQYKLSAEEIQATQGEILRAIAERLRISQNGTAALKTSRQTIDPQAYRFYLLGMLNLRHIEADNLSKALDYFNQAIVLDPDFAAAWVGVARTHEYFAGNSLIEPKQAISRAKAAIERALVLEDTLPEAHALLGRIKQNEWDWTGAEREYRRALELNPNHADAHHRYGEFLIVMGRHHQALKEIKQAQALDPLQIPLRQKEAWVLYAARRYDEALEILEEVNKLEPESHRPYFSLALTHAAKGNYERAIEEFRKGIRTDGETSWTRCYLGYALARAGYRKEAVDILAKLTATREYVSPAELAVLYIGLDKKEEAIGLLEKAYAAHDLQMQNLNVDPHYDSLRTDPRFQELVRRVGLSPQI